MKIVAADWIPYELRLTRPWHTSRGSFETRRGRLLRLKNAAGLIGWGDCAPLPSFGISESRAVDHAEESALLDLAAQTTGLPLNAWLSGEATAADIAVNANLGAISNVNQAMIAATLIRGYRVIKLKVGINHWRKEIARLRVLASGMPRDASFRLDANAAWNVDDAAGFLEACCELPVEGVEEPLAETNREHLARLQEALPYPIAIDESLELVNEEFFRHPAVRRIVLKPARQGGMLRSMETALRARASGVECIITSSLESSCGLLACAHLAAAVAPHGTHGLGTAEWLAEDTGSGATVTNGRLSLPKLAGLGFQPKPST